MVPEKSERRKERSTKASRKNIRNLATKRKPDGDYDFVEEAAAKKRRKMRIVDWSSELDSDLKVIIEQEELQQHNEAHRLEIWRTSTILTVDSEERRATNDLPRALIKKSKLWKVDSEK